MISTVIPSLGRVYAGYESIDLRAMPIVNNQEVPQGVGVADSFPGAVPPDVKSFIPLRGTNLGRT